MLDEAIAQQVVSSQQTNSESVVKLKTTGSGVQEEPKLQAKKYRRTSRRSHNQALQDLCLELTDTASSLEKLEELALDD